MAFINLGTDTDWVLNGFKRKIIICLKEIQA